MFEGMAWTAVAVVVPALLRFVQLVSGRHGPSAAVLRSQPFATLPSQFA